MKHTYRCPECDEIMIAESENFVCKACDHEMSLQEAEEKFDEGDLVMVVEATDDMDKDKDYSHLIEEFDVETPEVSISETVEKLFEGEDTDAEFKKKAATLFESTLNEAIAAHKAALDEKYKEAFIKALEEKDEELTEQVNDYLKYVVSEFLEANKPVIENKFMVERAQSLLEGLRDLLEEHNVVVETEEESLVEKLTERVDELSEELNKEISENLKLREQLDKISAEKVIDQVAEKMELTDSQKEKLVKLAETVDFVSEETYAEKLEILAEAFVSGKKDSVDEGSNDDDGGINKPLNEDSKDSDPFQKLIAATLSEIKKS